MEGARLGPARLGLGGLHPFGHLPQRRVPGGLGPLGPAGGLLLGLSGPAFGAGRLVQRGQRLLPGGLRVGQRGVAFGVGLLHAA